MATTAPWQRANFLAGEWRPAQRGARAPGPHGTPEDQWPQSDAEDLALARRAAAAAHAAWARSDPARRLEAWCAAARALERDASLWARLAERFALAPEELAGHARGLEQEVAALGARPLPDGRGVAWLAPDWRELVRAPLLDLARESLAGRAAVLLADARVPELGEALMRAAAALPPGTVALLHGARRELLAQALAASAPGETVLVASALAEGMPELRRLSGAHEARLRALRCGVLEVEPGGALEACAADAVERAFGRGTTLCGQLPGALGRVFCPARVFSRFTEHLLAELERRAATGFPPQVDEEAAARARGAWELGLDEGATCIAGGEFDGRGCGLAPTVFTNVEPYMESARRQDPLPVLCLLRG
ncbi:MAG TPA: aldehyde dehydrogenase family protein [Planctomycetota bacterium]